MALSRAEIEAVVRDVAGKLEGGRIERIDRPERHTLVLSVRRGRSRYWLLLCAHPRFSRIHLLTRRPEERAPAAGFCNVARQHLTGSPLERIWQVENDRVVVIQCVERDELRRRHPVRLIAELVGVGSNLILVDERDRVLGSLFSEDSKRRRIAPGVPYQPLPAPSHAGEKAARNRFEGIESTAEDPLALSRAVQNTYAELEAQEKLELARQSVLRALEARLKRLERRCEKLQGSLLEARNAEDLRKKGELLKIALPKIVKGQRAVTVRDLFSEGQPQITIELNPGMSPQQNIQACFKQYKKLTRSRAQVAANLSRARSEITLFQRLTAAARDAGGPDQIEELKDQARAAGLRFDEDRPPVHPGKPGKGPREFLSRDGLKILVAKNEKQNRELTFSIARGNDYWLHLLGWPGPHVIVQKPPGADVPLETLLDAAHLAIHFSKIRGTDFAQVVYTLRKYVRQLPGAPQGHVSYSSASTLQVRFDHQRMARLLQSRSSPAAIQERDEV